MAGPFDVHMFCSLDPAFVDAYHQDPDHLFDPLSNQRYSVLKVLAGMASPPQTIVDKVLAALGTEKIQFIRILAHGNSGVLFFPGMANARLIATEYSRFKPHFAPQPRLEIHGCGVASDTSILKDDDVIIPTIKDIVPGQFRIWRQDHRGLQYLRRAAAVFGIPVVGGINTQVFKATGWDWSYIGDTLTVFPDGHFVWASEGTRRWDFGATERAANQYFDRIMKFLFISHDIDSVRARKMLMELIREYAGTRAAEKAWGMLKYPDLKNPFLLPDSPDGFPRLG